MNDGLCTCAFPTGYTCECYNKKPSNYDRLIAAFIKIRDYQTDSNDNFELKMNLYIDNVMDTIEDIEDLLCVK